MRVNKSRRSSDKREKFKLRVGLLENKKEDFKRMLKRS